MPEDIIYYKNDNVIVTEVYTIVFDSSNTSTTSECSLVW